MGARVGEFAAHVGSFTGGIVGGAVVSTVLEHMTEEFGWNNIRKISQTIADQGARKIDAYKHDSNNLAEAIGEDEEGLGGYGTYLNITMNGDPIAGIEELYQIAWSAIEGLEYDDQEGMDIATGPDVNASVTSIDSVDMSSGIYS